MNTVAIGLATMVTTSLRINGKAVSSTHEASG